MDPDSQQPAGLFQHYGVTPGTVRRQADRIEGHAGDVEGLEADVTGAHRPAQDGVAGLLEAAMAQAPQDVRDRTGQWLRSALFAAATVRLFADAIETYNTGVDELNRRYRVARGDNFGVPDLTAVPDATPAETQAAQSDHRDRVADAGAALRADLFAQKAVLDGELDAAAAESAGMLDRGPDDATSVLRLYQAGALHVAAPLIFGGVDFSGIDPVTLYENLLRNGQLPPNLESMSAGELDAWFREHPGAADAAALLLLFPSLTPDRERVVRAVARFDAASVNRGMRRGGTDLAAIDGGVQRLREINQRIAGGERLTEGERVYLHSWFNEVGADNLGRLPAAVLAAVPLGVDPALFLSPVADAVMNLSDHTRGGHYSADRMPQAIQDLLDTSIGVQSWDGRYPNEGWTPEGGLDYRMEPFPGLARYNGFADLLSNATVDGGEQFTIALADSAISVRQELNEILDTAAFQIGLANIGGPDGIARFADDSGASTMLSVVARNENVSAQVLLSDPDRRAAVLGLNWDDDAGAIALVRAGTDRESADGGGTTLQAEAALAVIQEVGGDRNEYLDRMSEGMQEAAVQVGVSYIEAFGRPAGASGLVPDARDALGRSLGPMFELSIDDRDRYLQFVAGAGAGEETAENEAIAFQAYSVAYSHVLLADAFRLGDHLAVNEALRQAGTLDGAITRATFEYHMDILDDETADVEARNKADSNRNTAMRSGITFATGAASTLTSLATGGAAAPFTTVVSGAINSGAAFILRDDPVPVPDAGAVADASQRAYADQRAVRYNHLVVSSAVAGGVITPEELPPSTTRTVQTPSGPVTTLVDIEDIVGSQTVIELRQAHDLVIGRFEHSSATGASTSPVAEGANDEYRRDALAEWTRDEYDPDTHGRSAWRDDDRLLALAYGSSPPVVAHDPDDFPR